MPVGTVGKPRGDWTSLNRSDGSVSLSEGLISLDDTRISSAISRSSARFINSVSDLCAADEIDALLDEIRDLDPLLARISSSICQHGDSLQDFEIDGSISQLPQVLERDQHCASAGSIMNCDSRTSVHSWDSHALYSSHHNHHTMDDVEAGILGGPVSIYCDCQHVKTHIGILRLALIVTSLIGMICLLSSGTEAYGVFMLPFVARIRLMLFIILFTTLLTFLLLFLDITLLYHAFPFHYHRWAIAVYTMECAAFMGSSALIVTLVKIYQDSFPWIQPSTRNTLIAASAFGFLAGVEALALAIYGFYDLCRLHLPKREDTDQLTLTERANLVQQQASSGTSSGRNEAGQPGRGGASIMRRLSGSGGRSGHKISGPVVSDEPAVTSTVWPIDDTQPCSSKHAVLASGHH